MQVGELLVEQLTILKGNAYLSAGGMGGMVLAILARADDLTLAGSQWESDAE